MGISKNKAWANLRTKLYRTEKGLSINEMALVVNTASGYREDPYTRRDMQLSIRMSVACGTYTRTTPKSQDGRWKLSERECRLLEEENKYLGKNRFQIILRKKCPTSQ